MFRRIDAAVLQTTALQPSESKVRVIVDGTALECRETDSVAAALFAANVLACRDTAVSGAARGPYCMMGVCYDCLVSIDGRPNQQACMTRVRDGMRVERQPGAREVAA